MTRIRRIRAYRTVVVAGLACALFTSCAGRGPKANPWALETAPYFGLPESIGNTGSGCLAGAVKLDVQPGRLELMRPERRRHYAHPLLKSYLDDLAKRYSVQRLGALIVGDVAQVRGGPFLTGHKSHQTGLDVDLWFDVPKPAAGITFSLAERQNISPRKLGQMPAVAPALWTKATRERIRIAALDPRVERIFVHPSVKQAFCAIPAFQKDAAQKWMSKLRPWWGHDYHFHVRLKCPADNRQCLETAERIPAGNGCDASLEWWFTEEATAVGKAPEHQPGADPDRVPPACLSLLTPPIQ